MEKDQSIEPLAVIGLISDTHGMLRPEAVSALEGVDLIVHAGDIDVPAVLEGLQKIAPVHAVLGNMDPRPLFTGLSDTAVVEAAGHSLYVLHDLYRLDLEPGPAGFDAVVFGHSHHPLIEERSGVLFVNPGSAGPGRFGKPVSVARLVARNGRLSARIIELAA
jgi:putative phosphoesterase